MGIVQKPWYLSSHMYDSKSIFVGPVCSPKEICVSATLMLALVQMLLSIDDE